MNLKKRTLYEVKKDRKKFQFPSNFLAGKFKFFVFSETSTNDDVETLPSTSNILLKSKIYTDDDDDTKKNVSLDDCPKRLPVSDENDVTKSEEETETTTKYYCIRT